MYSTNASGEGLLALKTNGGKQNENVHSNKLERVLAWLRKIDTIQVSQDYKLESFKTELGSKLRIETIEKSLGIIKEIMESPQATQSTQTYQAA